MTAPSFANVNRFSEQINEVTTESGDGGEEKGGSLGRMEDTGRKALRGELMESLIFTCLCHAATHLGNV